MTSSDDSKNTDGGAVPRHAALKTLPSLDVDTLMPRQRGAGVRATVRAPTVQLAQQDLVENTGELTSPVSQSVLEDHEPHRKQPGNINRDQILEGADLSSSVPEQRLSRPHPQGIARLIATLNGEALEPSTPFYMPPGSEDPFDGMLGATLELKLDPGMFAEGEKSPARGLDADLRWLSPNGLIGAKLPNAYGWSDRDVADRCLEMFDGLKPVAKQRLPIVGCLARLEYQVTDLFAAVGECYVRLAKRVADGDGADDLTRLRDTGVFDDPDVLGAMRLWREELHGPEFWADDDGQRMKAIRLLGAYVLRKYGQQLSGLTFCAPADPEGKMLLCLVERVKESLKERQHLIQIHFPMHSKAFATSYLVHRGINAQPGFFWLESPLEQL